MTTNYPVEPVPAAEIATWARELRFPDIPGKAVRTAELAFVDTVGVTLAGSTFGAGKRAGDLAQQLTARRNGDVRVLGRDFEASLTDAVFSNGTAGHCLDWDDFTMFTPGHPSVTTIPAILGIGDIKSVSGKEALEALVLGWQVHCYLGAPICPGHHDRGWHSTATLGVFSAAAATAYLLDLDVDAFIEAMNMAASTPAGLLRMHGTMTKPMHVGQALRSGVSVALLAERGCTADGNAIGGENGFFDLYAHREGPDLDALSAIDTEWSILAKDVNVKKYPSCGFTHTIIEGARQLTERHDIQSDEVDTIRIVGSELGRKALKHDDPDTTDQAKFSAHFAAAIGILRDRIGVKAFGPANLDDPEIETLRRRVTYEIDADLPEGSNTTTVHITRTSGETYSVTIENPPGHPENPLSDEEFRKKFITAATMSIDEKSARITYEQLDSLRSVDDVTAVLPRG